MARPRDNATLDMFEIPLAPEPTGGSLDYATELRNCLSAMIDEAIKRSVIRNRYDLAARMSELTGQDITKVQIDSWTAESKTPWRFPFEYAAAYEAACESTRLQELLGRKRGSRILVGEETLLAEMGRIQQAKDDLTRRERALRERMRGKR